MCGISARNQPEIPHSRRFALAFKLQSNSAPTTEVTMRALFTLAVFALTMPALASPASDAPAFDRSTEERVTDGIGMGLSAGAGALAGGLGGAFFAAKNCDRDNGLIGACVGTFFLGFSAGFIGGGGAGALIFDTVSDGDGSLWAMAGGAGLGLIGASYALSHTAIGEPKTAMAVLVLGTAGGAGLGYALFDSPPAVPSVAVLPDGQGGTQLSAALSGTF
jgi:hypothetical protein